MKAVESGKQGVRVCLDMGVIQFKNGEEKLGFGVSNGLDDKFVIAREVEEGARLPGRAKFGKDVLGGERDEVVSRIELEVIFPELAEHP